MTLKKQLGQFTIFIFAIVSLAACGGGDSNDGFSGSTRGDLAGDWITGCIPFTDGSSEIRTASFLNNNNGDDVFFAGLVSYADNDCSSGSETLVIGGPVSYVGGYTASECNAEKFDATATFVSDGDVILTDDAFQQFLADTGISEQSFDLACKRGQQLLLGDDTGGRDGTTSGQRPTSMRVEIPYNVWNRSGRAAKKNSAALGGYENSDYTNSDHAKQINNSLRSLSK